MQRESFRSRLGFLLVSAGCAIGIGNVWRFPYVAGQNGGGLFVLIYLVCLLVMGVPVLTMELAVGRASRKGAVQGSQALETPGSKWHIHGITCLYHEATFAQEHALLAQKTFHSTPAQAAQIARDAQVQRLILGHFSSRYKSEAPLLAEAQQIFPDTLLAEDGMKITL